MKIEDLLGAVVQSGMTKSSNNRIKNSVSGGGLLDSLAGMLGGGADAGAQSAGSGGGGLLDGLAGMLGGGTDRSSQASQGGGMLGGLLGNILNDAGRAVGGNKNLALGGLGALVGSMLGGKKGLGGAVGGGLMALLGAMAFQALKGKAGQQAKVPLGLAAPRTDDERSELERNSVLVLKSMINAAKADGRIDENEVRRILGKVQESGADSEAQEFLTAEMRKPMITADLAMAAKGQPELAAQMYAASLLAIEVDTPAEKKYLEQLGAALGLDAEVRQRIHQAVGLQPA